MSFADLIPRQYSELGLAVECLLDLDSDLCRVWNPFCEGMAPSWASPMQACLRVIWRSYHQDAPAVRPVGLVFCHISQFFVSLFLVFSETLFTLSTFQMARLSLHHYLSTSVYLLFFFCSGRQYQCEIMVNAPWQSDTTHSPGPAPSGFNLIWSEKRWGEGGWRTGYWKGIGGCARWKLVVLLSSESFHHPSFFQNCPLPTSHVALTPSEEV